METRKSALTSTTAIFNQLGTSTKPIVGGLLGLLLPNVTIAGAPPHPAQQEPKLDSIYFYDSTRTSIYQLIVKSNGYANDMIVQIREGLCGADAGGTFPIVNFEKIGEWGWNNLATLLRAVNAEVQQSFEECINNNASQRAELQQEASDMVLKVLGILFLAFVVIVTCGIIGCCVCDSHVRFKDKLEAEKNRKAGLETKKLLSQMEQGETANYGSMRP